jgi:hypothetical protein
MMPPIGNGGGEFEERAASWHCLGAVVNAEDAAAAHGKGTFVDRFGGGQDTAGVTSLRRLSPKLLTGALLLVLTVVAACENELLGPTDDSATPACQIRDADLDFGPTLVGQLSGERVFTIRNTGGGILAGQVALEPGSFEVTAGGGNYSLAPGQLRRVGVRFRPMVPGAHSAQLRLGTNCRFVALSGEGMVGDVCRVEPETLDFGAILVGEGAVERSFTLFNDGTTTLSGVLAAPCGSYSIISGGGAWELPPGQFRVVTVRFAPTGAGTENCLVETGLAACADVNLLGEGLNQLCDVTPNPVSFGDACTDERVERIVTLRNPGTAPLSGSVSVIGNQFVLRGGGGPYTLAPGESRDITVAYQPNEVGAHTGTLRLGAAACGDVPLEGSASLALVCELSTNELRFDNVPTSGSQTQSFTIVNSGCGNGLITLPADCGGVFDLGGGRNLVLGPGQSFTVMVTFRPVNDQPVSCSLDLGPDCPPLRLVGTGMTVPVCRLTPEVLDFGPVTVGQNLTRTFTIKNDGDGTLSGSVAPGCDDFTVTAGGGNFSLGPQQVRSVTVRFQPTGPGNWSCVLGLGNGPCAGVTLSGRGDAPPACELTPSSLLFGGVVVNTTAEKSFVVRNAGGGMLNGTVSENCNAFEIVAGAGTYSLAGGESRTVTVRFRPTVQGNLTCGIGLGSPSCNNVAASGTGTAAGLCRVVPADLDFGTVFVGESADRTVTLSNLGGATISGNITESCNEFSIVSGGGPFAIGSGGSVTVTVRFTPTGTGTRTCSIQTGTSDCSEIPATGVGDVPAVCQVSDPALDFGSVVVNGTVDRTLTVTNTGGSTLIGNLTEPCEDFVVLAGGGAFSLGAGQSRVATIRFKPVSAGAKSCTLSVGEACPGVPLSGTGTAPPSCQLSQPSLTFPLTVLGESSERTFMITNAGGGTLSGTVSSPCNEFAVIGGATYSLTAGQSATVTVRFTPAQGGTRFCTLETGSTICADLPASGTGDPPPVCDLSPTSLSFGTVGIGASLDRAFTITNDGGQMLTGNVSLSGCPEFTIVSGAGAYVLPPNQSHVVTVRLSPTSGGPKSCTIETGSTTCADVPATGTGESLPVCSLSATSLAFGLVTTGSTSDQSFMISNTGGGTLTGNVTESCGEFSLIAGGGSFNLTMGQSRTVTVRFAPTSFGPKNCTVDLGTTCADVTASGTGAVGFATSVRPIIINSDCGGGAGCHGQAQVDLTVYANAVARTNANDPPNSLLLIKPGPPAANHSGGEFPNFAIGQPDYQTILLWIQQGTRP